MIELELALTTIPDNLHKKGKHPIYYRLQKVLTAYDYRYFFLIYSRTKKKIILGVYNVNKDYAKTQ